MKTHPLLVLVGTGFLLSQTAFLAGFVSPTSYDMPNGNGHASGGTFNYWDQEYTGAGSTTVDNAPLSGGLGNLTDGVIPTDNWHLVENHAGTGPYVGWTLDPTITFNFAGPVYIDDIILHLDDANGFGGVQLPSAISVSVDGGLPGVQVVIDPVTANPIAVTIDLNQTVTGTIDIGLKRSSFWVFLSEVQFTGATSGVRDAGSGWMMLGGSLAFLASIRRRR